MHTKEEKTLNAEQFGDSREEGKQFDSNIQEGEQTKFSIPQATENHSGILRIDARFGRVYIQLDDDYCEMYGLAPEQRVLDTSGMLRVDTGEDVLFLSPDEALDLADALRTVARLASR